MSRRNGFSLAELLIALVLTGVIGGIVAGMFTATNRLVRRHGDRIAGAEALRVPAIVLAGETRWLVAGRDIRAVAADSIALRAFRGGGIVCGQLDGALLVRYRGTRLPEPDKDSVLVLTVDGEWAAALGSSRSMPSACSDFPGLLSFTDASTPAIYAWTVESATSAGSPSGGGTAVEHAVGSPILLFESGSYHVSDGAFRYRRGDGGRQPLTAERIDVGASAFMASTPSGLSTTVPNFAGALVLRLVLRSGRGQPVRVRVPLVNSLVKQ